MKSVFNFNRPYVRNKGVGFTPIYLPGENYSIYINFSDIPPSETEQLFCDIIDAHSPNNSVAIILGDASIGMSNLHKLNVAGTVGYHIYIQNFVFPKIPDGQYYFRIYALGIGSGLSTYAIEKCRSNLIVVNSNEVVLDNTSYIEYRHNDQLFGVRYDLLPSFWQKFRLPINAIKSPDIQSVREQYRQASGQRELRNSKSFRDIKQTLEMYWANSEDYEALSAMLEHTEVKINGSKLILLDQIKVEQPSDFSEQFKGTFTVIVKEDEQLNYAPEGFLYGGTNNYIYTNFIKGN